MQVIEQIKLLKAQINRIEMNATNTIGGPKEFFSGRQTYLKPAAEKKVASMNAKIDALLGDDD